MKRHYTLSGLLLCLMTLFTLSASAQPDKDYLCFTANTAGSTVKLVKSGSPTAIALEYSTDGTNWNDYTIGTTTSTLITLTNEGDKVYFRNKADEVTGFSTSTSAYYRFIMTQSIAASGNVMSLVDKTCQTTTIPCDYCFYYLFYGCKVLTSAPALPATTLEANCYNGMFNGCSALTTAPELPATTLEANCYTNMFSGCKALTTAPELPATTLAAECYKRMFVSCSLLDDIKIAFSAWPTTTCTSSWVSGVSSTGTFSCPGGLSTETIGISNTPSGWDVKNTYDLAITSETGWASMCVNLPLQVPEDENVKVYYASAASGSTITLTQIEAGTVMAAKTAVIVKGTGTVSFPIAGEAGTSFTNLFQGSSVGKACNAGENYVLDAAMSSEDKVNFSSYAGTTLTGHEVYIPVSAVGGASSIQFRFDNGLDPDAEYVIVTYQEGGETKTVVCKTTDLEKIEWLKGADVE